MCIGPQIPELILSKLPNKGRLKGTTNHLVSVSRSCTTTTLQPPLRASVHRCHQRPGPAPTSPRRSWAGTAARSPRPAPPAGWRGDQGLPSCRRGRGKLLALGPRYKTKLIFPAADPCPCLGLLSRPHPDWTRLTAPPRRPRQLRQRPPPSYKSKFAAHDFSDLGQSTETPPWLLTLDANQWWVFHFLFHFNIVHAPSLWLSSF